MASMKEIRKPDENSSCTTIAIGQETYTIVQTSMNSRKEVSSSSGDANTPKTIRIYRRSRSGRPSSEPSGNVKAEREDFDGIESQLRLPGPETAAGVEIALHKVEKVIDCLKQVLLMKTVSTVKFEAILENMEYIYDAISHVAIKKYPSDIDEGYQERIGNEAEDDLSELKSEVVPEEVRKWLASTFAKQETTVKRKDERPSFKSVANAIRTGIFIERIYRRMSSSQLMIVPIDVQKMLKKVDKWNFDTFLLNQKCNGSPLRYLGYELLTRHGCLHKFKIPPSMLETMLNHLEYGYSYNGNPYHNNMHACDVTQTVHYFISQTGLSNWMSDLEIFTSLIAAMIHDYDHSGTTNNFHVNSSSKLAILYNDRAVLENHHVSAFFRMIQEHDCNIFLNMQRAEFKEFRNLCIEMVLHTDMSQHFSQLKTMKTLLQQHNEEASFDKTKVLCLMLHSCDVSHPAKIWSIHHLWTARCMEEFFQQGDREADLGLDYSPLCDRHNTMVPQSQIGFIDFIVSPTLSIFGDILDTLFFSCNNSTASERNPDSALFRRPWTEILADNRSRWQEKHESGEQNITYDNENEDDSWISRPSSSSVSSAKSERKMIPISAGMTVDTTSKLYQSKKKYKEISLEDLADENVLSRSESPDVWRFDDKETLKAPPPRPNSASQCSPPIPRKFPISVDHHLRK